MEFKRLTTGMLASNCYILGNNGEGVIIDPGASGKEILEAVNSMGIRIKYIILTHAHIDHIVSMDEIRGKLNAQVMIHEADAGYLSNPWYNGSSLFGLDKSFRDADILLKDGEVIEVSGMKLEVIHTPGHTPGGICLRVDDKVFTGDTLFKMSVGRTDLGNGDMDALMNSLKNKLMQIDDSTIVYPGHGTSTTIGYEKENNPYI